MKSYLKTYKIKLTTLAPVFIGSGKDINKAEYVFDGKSVYVIDQKKLMTAIIKKNLTDKYLAVIGTDKRGFNLKMWLDKNGITDYKSLMAYELMGVQNINEKKSMKEIKACIKNAYNMPYIPGSSLKGAIRTVILWNMICNDSKTLNSYRNKAMKALDNNGNAIKREFRKITPEIEKRYLNKSIDDTNISLMRGIIIGDSKPLSLDDIVICQKFDVNVNGKERQLNILRECIRPNVEIEFDLTIDESIFNIDADTICDMIKQYSNDYYDLITSNFVHAVDEENAIFIGGGAGYFSKTFTYGMFEEDDAVEFTRKYLSKTTNPKHKHFTDNVISPHMQKCTMCDGKVYEMGKCRIEIIKV